MHYDQLDSSVNVKMDKQYPPLNVTGNRRDDDASDRSSSTKSSQVSSGGGGAEAATKGILKNTSSSVSGGGGVKKKPVPLKPTTILDLGDRDLVIIDGVDIQESVQNESEVIVVDHPPKEPQGNSSGEVDLVDILGHNWPELAGDTAHVLNTAGERRSSGGPVMKPNLGELTTRNKSMNIFSHLKSSNNGNNGRVHGGTGTMGRNGTGHHHGSGGSTNSSFESSNSGSTSASERRKSEYAYYIDLNTVFIELLLETVSRRCICTYLIFYKFTVVHLNIW